MSQYDNFWVNRLKEHATNQPDKIAFKEAGKEGMTYGQFYEAVCGVAKELLAKFGGKLPEAPIAVTVERNLPSLVSIFGICAAGGWYVPVDSGLPAERASALLSVCSPAAIVLSTEGDPFPECELPKIILAEVAPATIDELPLRAEELPLFGIFTSGSTGLPKLVVKDARGIREFIETYCKTFELTAEDHFGNQIPFYFDASTKDIFATIYLGATTVIFPQKVFSFPMNLVTTLDEEKISTFVCVPSVMSVTAQYDVFSKMIPGSLKRVLFVGERMPIKSLNYWRNSLPETKFVNLYGSTEVAGNSCYYIIDRDFENDDILPIGHAFETAKVFLLDENGAPANEGEICVAGSGLAIGYYHDEEKTANAFKEIALPEFNGRIYHSGDFGRLNEQGEFICVTRQDSQIKHIGHRIELGDIEACVSGLDYVFENCCIYDKEAEKIILFASCPEDKKRQIRKDLMAKLPKYMLPQEYICMEELPHNRNGKIDRAGLRDSWLEKNK